MRIAFSSVSGPDDLSYWSGTPYFMAREFEDLVHLGPLQLISQPFKEKHGIYQKLVRQTYIWEFELLVHKYLSMQVDRALKVKGDIDVILSPGSFPYPNAFLQNDAPQVFWADATFAGLVEVHPGYKNLCDETVVNGHYLQQRILDRSTVAIFTSDWAKETALANYKIDPSKVKVVPFGANLNKFPGRSEMESIIASRSNEECHLLFIGKNWVEKGGPFVIEVLRSLLQSKCPSRLTVLGCKVPAAVTADAALASLITNIEFLNKSDKDDEERLIEILKRSHFLLLPTEGDCFGAVICEANAWGIPALAHAVGGIPSVIANGVNGQTFLAPQEASAYAEHISHWFGGLSAGYAEYAWNAYSRFVEKLNWRGAAQKVLEILAAL